MGSPDGALEGVEEVMISQQVVEGTAGPLYMYAARAGGARAAMAKAFQGVGSIEQLQEYANQIAPMGQLGMKMFQQFLESGAAFARGNKGG